MRIRSQRLRALYSFIETVAGTAYRWSWLASNPVLARSQHTHLIERHMAGDTPDGRHWYRLPRQLCLHFLNNGKALAHFFKNTRKLRSAFPAHSFSASETRVVDTVLYLHETRTSGQITFWNMPGLEEELEASGKRATLAPLLYGELDQANLDGLKRGLENCPFPVVFSQQLFNAADLFRLLLFYFGYPFLLIWFLATLKSQDSLTQLFKDECIASLGADVTNDFLRYLYGLGITRNGGGDLTVISWCENRAGDKLFYKGLRRWNKHPRIVGVQTFLFPDHYLGCYINQSEALQGMAPDEIVVNGPYFLPNPPTIPARVGLSMRYRAIFDFEPKDQLGPDVVILLSYNDEASKALLAIVNETPVLQGLTLKIRLHPSHSCQKWRPLLPSGATLSDGKLTESLKTARLVIGTETGALLESIACAIPAINVETIGFKSLAYMPDLGKNKVWFEATNPQELTIAIQRAHAVSAADRKQCADNYRTTFFNQPQSGQLLSTFGM